MLELQKLAGFLIDDEEAFTEILADKTNSDILKEKKSLEGKMKRCMSRNETVLQMYEELFEKNSIGKVTDEMFMALSHKYETERLQLKEKVADIRVRLSELENLQIGKETFINAIRKFMQMKTLTAPLVKELIDHIDVYEAEGTGKNKTQRIVIYYRFVGYLEIPETSKTSYKADTRQGVAVEYLNEKKTA